MQTRSYANIHGVEISMQLYGKPMSTRKGKKPMQPKLTVTNKVFDKIIECVTDFLKEIANKLS